MRMPSRMLGTAVLGLLVATAAGCKDPKITSSANGRQGRTVKATIASFDPNAEITLDLDKYGSERPDDYAVQMAFNQSFEGMDACVLSAKQRIGMNEDKQMEGDLDVAVKLNPKQGRPQAVNATLPGKYNKDTKLKECIRGAVAKVEFPKYDGPPVVVDFVTELDAGSEFEQE